MYNQPLVHQKVSLIGFGLGGNYAFEMALREQRLRSVVVFYGQAPNVKAELRHIHSPVLAFYGQKETSLAKKVDGTTALMDEAGVDFKPVIYEQVGHAFFNEENTFAYNKETAEDAWRRMLSFLNEHSVL
jgi:carboxymethylenebutenolidase